MVHNQGMRKSGKLLLAAVLLAAIAAAIGFSLLRRSSGAGGLATWIGKQIVGITASYIEPTIEFKSVDYKAPYSVALHDVTLKARDGTLVASMDVMRVELAEMPSMGKPLQIKSVGLERPVLNLIKSPEGFKGLVPFVRATPGKTDATVDPNFRLSNVLQLRELRLQDGAVTYDPADGSPKMELRGLELNLDVQPGTGADAGWYAVKTTMGRKPQAVIDLDGSVNLDSMLARFKTLAMEVKVGPDTIAGLPPEIQNLVREHDASGDLKISAAGEASLADPMQATADVTIELRAFNLAFGDFKLPIDDAKMTGRLQGGTLTILPSGASLLKGTANFEGVLGLAQAGRPASLNWAVSNIDAKETLRAQAPAGAPPRYAGIVNANGTVATSLDNPTGAISGRGTIELRQGRLVGIPLVKALAEAMNVFGNFASSDSTNHTADVIFTLEPRGMNISDLTVTTEVIGIKGDGMVGFDRSLELTLAAGPMEKLSALMGKNAVSRLLGDISGSLVKYRVGGVIGAPTVKVDPLGVLGK